MSTLLRRRHAAASRGPRPQVPRPQTTLVEHHVIQGDHTHLATLARALRNRVKDHSGHLGEVHFHHEMDRVHLVRLWRGPIELRTFVEEAHPDLLAYREDSGAFPTVERTLWWSDAGANVTLAEAIERSSHLRGHGPGPRAFSLASPVPA
ncbi:DUF3291 domain-containing protein [Nocardiopsis sp. NPDC055551]|uniref:DUF3291 domain-containing protein n=1 Tax=Nocardiopsis sp. NPDC006832 TaxID=3157188 RepID=UPI0033C6BA00